MTENNDILNIQEYGKSHISSLEKEINHSNEKTKYVNVLIPYIHRYSEMINEARGLFV